MTKTSWEPMGLWDSVLWVRWIFELDYETGKKTRQNMIWSWEGVGCGLRCAGSLEGGEQVIRDGATAGSVPKTQAMNIRNERNCAVALPPKEDRTAT